MDMKTLSLVAAIMLAATSMTQVSNTSEFESFKTNNGKTYSSEEEVLRQAIFNSNLNMINSHNADETQTYKMAVNKFADLTQEEFEAQVLMPTYTKEEGVVDSEMVGNVDWIAQGKVTGVKDQGNCGSCWAFSALGPLESKNAINGASLVGFSEQQLTSCDKTSSACNGGRMDRAMTYLASNGVCTEASYPYTSGGGSVAACRQSSCTKSSFTINGSTRISASSSALQSAVASVPVAVAVAASNWSFYSSGIFSNCNTSLNHGVVLTGYTSSYWMVKNSWGRNWGESGYIRLSPGNTCGILNDSCVPR